MTLQKHLIIEYKLCAYVHSEWIGGFEFLLETYKGMTKVLKAKKVRGCSIRVAVRQCFETFIYNGWELKCQSNKIRNIF